jgi:Pectate lyase superfamily protein
MSATYATTSVATLLSLTGSFTAGDVAQVDAFATPDDGGGGDFYFEGTPPLSATITGATPNSVTVTAASNEAPIRVTTPGHTFETGESVLIAGVNAAANGAWLINKVSPTQFELVHSDGRGLPAFSGAGTAKNVKVTTGAAHGFPPGSILMISGVVGLDINKTLPDRWFPVGTSTETTFTLPSAASGTWGGGGLVGNIGVSVPSSTVAGRWLRRDRNGVSNVKWFGALGDGSANDAPAINACIVASGAGLPPYATYTGLKGGVVYFPPGNYRVASPINVGRHAILRGSVGGPWGTCQITADAGVTAIIIHSRLSANPPLQTPPQISDGDFSIVENLLLKSTRLQPQEWTPGTPYTLGTIVRIKDDNRYLYEATTVTGEGKSTSNFLLMPAGFTNTGMLYASPGNTVADNDITWTRRVHVGVLALRRAVIRDCIFETFSNAAVLLHGGTGDALTGCSGSTIERCRSVQCGVGFHVFGGDASAGIINTCDVEASGAGPFGWTGTGGHGIVDASFLGTTHIACQVAACTGKAYWTPAGTTGFSSWVGCYSEADCQPSNVFGAWLGGDSGAHFEASSRHTGYPATNPAFQWWRNISYALPDHPKKPWILADDRGFDALNSFYSDDDPGYAVIGDRYEHATDDPKGWWIKSAAGSLPNRRMTGYSGSKADEGIGHWRLFRGEFRGDDAAPYYLGVAANSKNDPYVRIKQGVGGHFLPGDRFEGVTTGAAGSYIGQVVATEGWTASNAWSAGFYTVYDQGYDGRPSLIVSPPSANGYVYAPTKAGSTASSPPTPSQWPTTYLGAGGIVPYRWHGAPGGAPYRMRRKVGDYGAPKLARNGRYYRVTAVRTRAAEWVDDDGNRSPTPPNPIGTYKPIPASPDANGYGYSDEVEPHWPVNPAPFGGTVTDYDLTWTEVGEDAPGGVPTYVPDGDTEWQCVGPVPTYRSYGLIV